jgi:serine/threonine protein kinase
MLRVGEQVGGQYVVEAALGSGGMGQVWQVRQRGSGARLALKVLHITSTEAAARIEREGRLQGALRHPNIVPVERMLTIGGQPALLMERIAGPSLAALLREHSLSVPQADALAAGLFAGIGAAHRAGIVHRDLKPANVLLDRRGDTIVPRITDFGLARPSAPEVDLTTSGSALGTPQHIAPEQIRSARHVDKRADLWALGCILYERACGQRAFDGEDVYGIFRAVMEGEYIDAGQLRSGLPKLCSLAKLTSDITKIIIDCATRASTVEALTSESTGTSVEVFFREAISAGLPFATEFMGSLGSAEDKLNKLYAKLSQLEARCNLNYRKINELMTRITEAENDPKVAELDDKVEKLKQLTALRESLTRLLTDTSKMGGYATKTIVYADACHVQLDEWRGGTQNSSTFPSSVTSYNIQYAAALGLAVHTVVTIVSALA